MTRALPAIFTRNQEVGDHAPADFTAAGLTRAISAMVKAGADGDREAFAHYEQLLQQQAQALERALRCVAQPGPAPADGRGSAS